ncbi:MAG TPA: hypothetical protein VGO36_03280 [Solirubrobacterales bacterium]|jgi:hypothetical protein|nr:hypothetical protein [Solirubrobacterales bacterium]
MSTPISAEPVRGRRRFTRFALPLLLMLAGLLAVAPAADATFHLIKVREVHPGTGEDSYVELQMFAAGQSFLSGHALTVYNTAGSLVHKSTFVSGVANAQNQGTILVGDSGVEAAFGVKPDLVDSGLAIPAAGGAACWNAGGLPADCVAWGNFTGDAALLSATGTSAGSPVSPTGIASGKSVRRTIEPGCPTLLEESDDSDQSATDFKEVTPAPRNNLSPITETTCAGAPNTAIDDRPAPRSNSTAAVFTYEAPTATGYECRLDAEAFAACPDGGPKEYSSLAEGSHTFQVRGINGSGPDPTPASYTWTVDTVAPTVTIDAHPADPSAGTSASFAFHASEASTFECSMSPPDAAGVFSACVSGKTYLALGNGLHSFEVRPTDLATNAGAPAAFAWTVDNSLADTTPPQTTIDQRPPDPSPSSSATFAYSSSEPGSSFECSLDSAPFLVCASDGAAYTGLASGPHSFQVRATDASGNLDPTPAGYSFTVALPTLPGNSPPPSSPVPPRTSASPPQTVLGAKPAATTRDRTPSFRFRADLAGVSFECALDGKRFKPCRSPFTTATLKPGQHTFSVRAVLAGVADPTPAKAAFKVLPPRAR